MINITQEERRELILASYGRGWFAGIVIGLVFGGVSGWLLTVLYYYSIIVN
jgi:hypothetical protein